MITVNSINIHILSTRFNNETWKQLSNFREKYKSNNKKKSVVYNSPSIITPKVPVNTPVIVMEMNNDINKIMGMSIITNHYFTRSKKYRIYKDDNYNRYTYFGKYYVDIRKVFEYCETQIEREQNNKHMKDYQFINDMILYYEQKLFYGYTHMKRGDGFTILNKKFIEEKKDDTIQFLTYLFNPKYVFMSL